MLHLLNSAVMLQDGHYQKTTISPEEAKRLFAKYTKDWKSYIGYPNACRVLSELFELPIPISREETNLKAGDVILCARLRYRVLPCEKGERSHGENLSDYEFSIINFAPEPG